MAVTTLSSRAFNQHFGKAKKAAEDGPVFITDRGEQTHVLLKVEEYRRITAKRRTLYEALACPELAKTDADFGFPQMDGPFLSAEFD